MKKSDIERMKASHKVLAEFDYEPARVDYEPARVERGYAGQILYINLSDNTIASKPVTQQMKDIFIGGRGFGLWLLWNGIKDDTKWNDPENEIIISSGPIGGTTTYPGAGKSLVVTISPLTGSVMDSNVGGHFGPLLKFAGWDAIEIQGKAEKDVIVFINAPKGKITIEEAPEEPVNTHLLSGLMVEMYAESEEDKRNISSVSAGIGGDNTLFGCLNLRWDWGG